MGHPVDTSAEQPAVGPGEAFSAPSAVTGDLDARVEHARVEASLRESEARYRTLFTSMGEGFALCEIVLDRAGAPVDYRVLDVNPAYETVVGLAQAQVVGRLATEIVPGIEPGFIEAYGRVALGREPARFESRLGGGRWLSTNAFPVGPAAEGRFAVVVSDVSERHAAEDALRASAERALYRVALTDALRPLTSAADVQAAAVRLLGEHLGAARAFYAEAEGEDNVLRVDRPFVAGSDAEGAVGRYRLADFGPGAAADYLAGRTRAVADARTDDRLSDDEQAAYAHIGVRAFVGVPLVREGRLAGVLGISGPEPRAWTPEEVALVEETAERMWAAAERARSGAALRASEARYRTLFESMDEGFCVIEMLYDADGAPVDYRYVEVNPAFEAQTGFTGAVGRTVREFVPDHEPRWFEVYHRVLATGEPVRFVGEAADIHRWFDLYAFPLGPEAGPRVAILGADVTERVLAEAALSESEARYRTLFESIDEGFCVLDILFDADDRPVDWLFVETNPAFEAQTGLKDTVGRRMRELIPDHDDHWFETYGRVARTGEPIRFVSESQSMDQWFDLYAFPVGEPDSHRVAVLFNNITAQKRSEAEIRTLNETLEGRVAERTRQVRQLAARLAVAEQDERQRIAHILHDDLQQQLYGLSMVLVLLQRSPDPAAVAGLAARATDILDGAVQMARSLATELSPSILQAARLAEVLAWTAEEEREKHGLDITVEVAGDPQVADPALRILVYQSLREILFNVVKHAGVQEARLVASSETDADGAAVAVVRVEDDGAGFDMVTSGTDRPGGFGLFSVRERVHLVGGRFEVESVPGRGTRVTLAVPAGVLAPESP